LAIISGVAVFVSFIFLAFQIHQSNRNQQALMQQGRANRSVELLLRVTEPTLHESLMRGEAGDLTLDAAKADIFIKITIAAFVHWEDAFIHSRAGVIDPDGRSADETILRFILATPAYRAAWKTVRNRFSGKYQEYIDAIVREGGPMASLDLGALWKSHMVEELAKLRVSEAVEHGFVRPKTVG
jgi:hypothetical protein